MFYITDYAVFFGILMLSLLIGFYFGCRRKPQTTDEYLLGGKSMSIIPVSVSLVASYASGVTMLALPSEIYLYGSNFLWIVPSAFCILLLNNYVYLPVTSKLHNASVFDYLEQRFNRKIRLLASLLFILQLLLYNPVVAYIPAIAFSQASGIDPYLITPIVCFVCTLYTAIGGFKAVIWTDALQFSAMIGCIITIFVLGVYSVEGFENMFSKATAGHRFDFDVDPTIRDGFFPIILGGTILWLYVMALQPPSVQKYLSVRSLSNARRVSIILTIGLVIFMVLNVLIGIVMYARYEKCDPISTGDVARTDQILPYFVMDVASNVPGLPGLFIAGIFSASMSTLSTMFNTLSAIIYYDFITEYLPNYASEKKTYFTLKSIVFVSGIVCTLFTFVVEKMGSLFQFINASQGLTSGLFVGLFSLGMMYPMANSKGAMSGLLSGFFGVGTIVVVNQWYKMQGIINMFPKPVSTENCSVSNITLTKSYPLEELPFVLFRLSHWYNALMAVIVVTFVGLIVSWTTTADKVYINPNLISPVSQCFLKRGKVSRQNIESSELTTFISTPT